MYVVVRKCVLFLSRFIKRSHFTAGCCSKGNSSSELIVDPLILHSSQLRQYRCWPPPSTPFSAFSLCFPRLDFFSLTVPALQRSSQPCSHSSPPRCSLKSIRSLSPSSGQNRKGTGSNKTEQQGWDGSSKVIKPHTQTQGSPQGH